MQNRKTEDSAQVYAISHSVELFMMCMHFPRGPSIAHLHRLESHATRKLARWETAKVPAPASGPAELTLIVLIGLG